MGMVAEAASMPEPSLAALSRRGPTAAPGIGLAYAGSWALPAHVWVAQVAGLWGSTNTSCVRTGEHRRSVWTPTGEDHHEFLGTLCRGRVRRDIAQAPNSTSTPTASSGLPQPWRRSTCAYALPGPDHRTSWPWGLRSGDVEPSPCRWFVGERREPWQGSHGRHGRGIGCSAPANPAVRAVGSLSG